VKYNDSNPIVEILIWSASGILWGIWE